MRNSSSTAAGMSMGEKLDARLSRASRKSNAKPLNAVPEPEAQLSDVLLQDDEGKKKKGKKSKTPKDMA